MPTLPNKPERNVLKPIAQKPGKKSVITWAIRSNDGTQRELTQAEKRQLAIRAAYVLAGHLNGPGLPAESANDSQTGSETGEENNHADNFAS